MNESTFLQYLADAGEPYTKESHQIRLGCATLRFESSALVISRPGKPDRQLPHARISFTRVLRLCKK